ncbi:MAG: SDR family oxidoreductase [Candidatus Latescibacteria bacterium]|nr:SDR family oxidoreductase [Candidatus Latescibacterota bacterium]
MGKLDGKVVLVTGASRGIGRGIARGSAREGASVVLAARDTARLQQTADEIIALGRAALVVPTDVTDEQQVETLFSRAMDRFGRLDVLYNNAGAFNGGPIHELSVADWDHVIAVNLRGPFLCTRQAFRIMKPQGGGRIINIGSISAQRVRPHSAPYSTSKHGIWGLTQVTALEGREYGIVCSCLHPGNVLIERRAASAATQDQEPMMSIDELAEVAVTMATLPPHMNMLEAIVLPVQQLYIGRG